MKPFRILGLLIVGGLIGTSPTLLKVALDKKQPPELPPATMPVDINSDDGFTDYVGRVDYYLNQGPEPDYYLRASIQRFDNKDQCQHWLMVNKMELPEPAGSIRIVQSCFAWPYGEDFPQNTPLGAPQ